MIRAKSLLVPAAAAVLGAAVGIGWERSRHEARSEDLIAAEIALLHRASAVPSCVDIRSAGSATGRKQAGDLVVHWRYLADAHKLQRVVVGPDLTTGYEEVQRDCP